VPGAGAFGALRDGGRVVNVGHSAGGDEPPPFEKMRPRGATLVGISSGWTDMGRKREVFADLMAAAMAGELQVDREVIPLSEVGPAWERQQGSPHKKLVIDVEGSA
jgi:NADPH:quinone reductase-like Zn-dependent oxidoreductase